MGTKVIDRYLNGFTMANLYDFKDKPKALQLKINYMLSRLSSMFKWEGLPDSIPQRMLELYLLVNGHCVITKVQDQLYAFFGSWGGVLDEYYRPTKYTVSNPFLKFYDNLEIGVNCVLCGDDSTYTGILPLLEMYGSAMVENELSMQFADINARIPSLITADNDADRAAAEEYIKKIVRGDLSAIGESSFFDGIRTQPYNQTSAVMITDLIEYEQYLKASLYNELGLNANYNMKRESLNSSESQMNNDALTPLIDDMLNMRKKICEDVNSMFGTELSVDFASAWKDNEIEAAAELEAVQAESDNLENPTSGKPQENLQTTSGQLPDNLQATSGQLPDNSDESDPEETPEDQPEDVSRETSEVDPVEEIKEDIEEIKEDIEEIQEVISDETTEETE